MRHVDPDTLAMLALGEDAAAPDAATHLATCAECAAELAALRHVVEVGRRTTQADVPLAPAPQVWERIRAELGVPAGASPGAPSPRPATAAPVTSAPPATDAVDRPPPPRPPGPVPEHPHGDVVDLGARRRRPSAWLAVAAAAAGIVVGGVGGAWWTSRTDAPDEATVLATAQLEPLPGWAATGVASLEEDEEGARVVAVQLQGDIETEGFREVWLLAPDLSGMVSLGLLEGSSGTFVLPEGIDVERYSVVDVSDEPFDGDATHSGTSVVRGPLDV